MLGDKGIAGARVGTADDNMTGKFMGQETDLTEDIIPEDGDIVAEAKKALSAGNRLIVADLEAKDLLAVADIPEAKDAIILDIRTSDDALRQEQCRNNVFHLAPSNAMRADALGQFLLYKKWTRWFFVHGVSSRRISTMSRLSGAQLLASERKSSTERDYTYDARTRDTDTGHQQTEQQMALLTQSLPDYDVTFVVDQDEAFGDYLLFNTTDPRPVVGTQGLVAAAWHPAFTEFSAKEMQRRFERLSHRYDDRARLRGPGLACASSAKRCCAPARQTPRLYGIISCQTNSSSPPLRGRASLSGIGTYNCASRFFSLARARWSRSRRSRAFCTRDSIPTRLASMSRRANAMRSNKYREEKMCFAVFLAALLTALAAAPSSPAATLFVTSERDNTVTVLDSTTLAIEKVIPVGTRPRGIAITPDYREVFVCIGDDDRMDVIDTKTRAVSRSIPNVLDPELVAIDPVGKRVYAANEEESQVTVIDRASGKIVGTVGVGAEPEGLTVSPDLSTVVNTSELTSLAHFINAKTLTIEDNVLVDQRPREAQYTHDGKQVLGFCRGWWYGLRDRRAKADDHQEDRVRHSRRAARS